MTLVSHTSFARRPAFVVLLALALSLTACGEYSPVGEEEDPDAASSPTASATATPTPTGEPDVDEDDPEEESVTYAWGLPPSDTSVSGNNGPAYGALLRGCESARDYLAQIDLDDQPFFGFTNPRYVVFYSAGLAIECDGDYGLARSWTDGAIATYGLDGTDRPGEPDEPDGSGPVDPPRPPGYGEPECDLYRTLVSALRQVDPNSLTCHAGTSPTFRSEVYETADGPLVMWDDPCTFDTDESAIEPANALEATPAFCVPVATPPRPEAEDDGDEPEPSPTGGATPGPTDLTSRGETGDRTRSEAG